MRNQTAGAINGRAATIFDRAVAWRQSQADARLNDQINSFHELGVWVQHRGAHLGERGSRV